VLAAQVHDHPAGLPLADILEAQARHFVAAQPAADHDGQHGAVALALQGGCVRAVDKLLGLALGEPVPGAGAFDLSPADIADALCGFGIQQSRYR
jgi:hypothetical protein